LIMVKTILIPNNTHIEFDIPVEYVGKRVEIVCSPVSDMLNNDVKSKMSDFWGILSDKTAEELRYEINKSRDEWERDI